MDARYQSLPAPELSLARLTSKRLDAKGLLLHGVLLVSLIASVGVLVVLLVTVFGGGWRVIVDRGWGFVHASLSSLPELAGVWQGVVGSALLMLFVVAVSFPLGIAAAVYLEEYARDNRVSRFINVNVRNLAGVPSIVYGLLGVAVFVELLKGATGGPSVISGGLTLAILVLPIVIITSAEALRAVPVAIREAGYGVGATRWQVIRSHVLPSAVPGILTGTILSLSRALGETAPLLLVGAVTGYLTLGNQGLMAQLKGQFTTLPTIIFAWATLPNANFRALTSAAIIVLLTVILLANATAIVLRNRYARRS
jgi:phosphate transport system permease protein